MISFYIVSSIFLLLNVTIIFCDKNQSKCFECNNVCCDSGQGIAKEICKHFKDSCENNCLTYPFQQDGKDLTHSTCSSPNEMCYTANGLIKFKIKTDNSVFTLRYIQRGCTPSCPVELCDFAKLKECKFPPDVSQFIEDKINKEKNTLIKRIHEIYGDEDVLDLGMGGELKCCKGEGCNTISKTEVAHTYLKDEL